MMKKMAKKTIFTLALIGMVAVFGGYSQNSQTKSETGKTPGSFLESGTFILGANYWASHAGTAIWSDWPGCG